MSQKEDNNSEYMEFDRHGNQGPYLKSHIITLHCHLAGFNNNGYKLDPMSIKYGGVSKDSPIKRLNLDSLFWQHTIFAKNKGRGLCWTQKEPVGAESVGYLTFLPLQSAVLDEHLNIGVIVSS